MTHPSRLERANALLAQSDAVHARVVVDPEPTGTLSTARNAASAWAPSSTSTHHLVIQDDAILTPGFYSHLEAAVARHPGNALCLFTEWGSQTSQAVRIAASVGAAYAPVLDDYMPTVAAIMPTEAAAAISKYLGDAQGQADDVAAMGFLKRSGIRPLVTVPNLVEHDGDQSVAGNADRGTRLATVFDVPSDTTWWERAELDVIRLPVLPWFRQFPVDLERAASAIGPGLVREQSDRGDALLRLLREAGVPLELPDWSEAVGRIARARFRLIAATLFEGVRSAEKLPFNNASHPSANHILLGALDTAAPGLLRREAPAMTAVDRHAAREFLVALVQLALRLRG